MEESQYPDREVGDERRINYFLKILQAVEIILKMCPAEDLEVGASATLSNFSEKDFDTILTVPFWARF